MKVNILIILCILFATPTLAKEVNLTCHTEFIDDKPSNNKIPIWFAKVDYKNKYMDWSDVDKSANREVKISEQTIVVYANSGVFLKKYININRINGTFTYLKPKILSSGKLTGYIDYKGKCSVGIKKKLF